MVHEYLPGSRLVLCANNLLHVSHLKGFIFRWTLFVWECRSLDMVNFLSHREQGKRGPSSSLWCCFLWRTRFLFCTYDFPQSGQRCRSTGTYLCGVENGWSVFSTSTSAETSITLPSVTPDISICNLESSDLVSLAWLKWIVKRNDLHEGALDRNMARLSIGTAMHSGSEHRKTGRAFSYPSIATSEYS